MVRIAGQPYRDGLIYGLYCTCHPSVGVRYVGQTVGKIGTRFTQHKVNARLGVKYWVYNWIRKHGIENIECSILESAPADILDALEIEWISLLKEAGMMLTNQSSGGNGQRGFRHTPEARAKMSATKIGMFVGEKNGNWGKKMPDSVKEKISRKKMGVKWTPERRAVQTVHRGEDNATSKVTNEDVLEIRRRYDSGERGISKDFPQIYKTTVYKIAKRQTWRHLP